VTALDQFLCRWGRELTIDPDEPPCPQVGTQLVVLHDPSNPALSSAPIRLCDEHVKAVSEESTPTTPDRIEGWRRFYDQGGEFEHKSGLNP